MTSRSSIGWGLALIGLGGVGCEPAPQKPDTTLVVHPIAAQTPTAEGLAYLRAIAQIHDRADAVPRGEARIRSLREGLALPVPANLAEAQVVRLDIAARLAEELLSSPHGPQAGWALLEPMLEVDRSLPLDRATARALVVLGDAAAQSGNDVLAAGSYARAIEVLSLLRQELER